MSLQNKATWQFGNFWDAVSAILAVVLITILVLMPVYLGYAAYKLNSKKSEVATKNDLVRLFSGLDLDRLSALVFNTLFMTRRLIIVTMLIFFNK